MTTRTVTIEVTADDIAQSPEAGCGSGCNCPVWRAARRVFPHLPQLWVTVEEIAAERPDDDDIDVIAGLPDVAVAFIKNYDRWRGVAAVPVDPFTFDVEVDERWLAGAS